MLGPPIQVLPIEAPSLFLDNGLTIQLVNRAVGQKFVEDQILCRDDLEVLTTQTDRHRSTQRLPLVLLANKKIDPLEPATLGWA